MKAYSWAWSDRMTLLERLQKPAPTNVCAVLYCRRLHTTYEYPPTLTLPEVVVAGFM